MCVVREAMQFADVDDRQVMLDRPTNHPASQALGDSTKTLPEQHDDSDFMSTFAMMGLNAASCPNVEREPIGLSSPWESALLLELRVRVMMVTESTSRNEKVKSPTLNSAEAWNALARRFQADLQA